MKTLLDSLNVVYVSLAIAGMILGQFGFFLIFGYSIKSDVDALKKSVAKIEAKMDAEYYVSTIRYDREYDMIWLEVKTVDSKLEKHIDKAR